MTHEPLKFWRSFTLITLGAIAGLLLLLILRIAYYDIMQYRPNMHPGIAFYFSPFLLLAIMIFSLPSELLFRYWYIPKSYFQAILFGFCYSTVLIWWVFPSHWFIAFVVNPIILRTIFSLTFKFSGPKGRAAD